jgi:hypothetical protein
MGNSWLLYNDRLGGVIEAMALGEENGHPVMRLRYFEDP